MVDMQEEIYMEATERNIRTCATCRIKPVSFSKMKEDVLMLHQVIWELNVFITVHFFEYDEFVIEVNG